MNVSLQARNPIVLHNGDVYVRMMLFFAMFLPLGTMIISLCSFRLLTLSRRAVVH